MEKQKRIFEIIKRNNPQNLRLVVEIEELLGISSDSAYKRISGKTELSFSELLKICDKYKLSLDEIISGKSKQGAFFHNTPGDVSDQDGYVKHMKQLLTILNPGSKAAKGMEFVFTAQDIPFYHFVKYPELAYFRLFVWNDILTRRNISYCKFCDELKKDRIISVYNEIYQAFLQTPSKEIWTKQTIYSTVRMLEYYFETEAFERKETVLLLLSQLESLLDTVRYFADSGYKGKTPFELYLCSVDLENNFMLIKNGEDLSCIVQLYAIKRMITYNEHLCAEIQKWMENLMLKSMLISGGASFKERRQFFNSAKRKVQELKTKVEGADAKKDFQKMKN